jgi:hypothetical protein
MSLCCPNCGSNSFDGASCNKCDYSISNRPLKISENIFYFKDPILYSLRELEIVKPPSSSGVYGWYFDEPPPYVPKDDCTPVKTGWWPFRKKWWLLYIGKALDLRFRVYDMHFNNKFWMNKSLSSLRLTLGCLLCKELNLYLKKNSDPQKDYTFGRKGDRKLSHWMAKHARVAWVETVDYVELEYKTINSYVLPLNTKDNPKPFDPLKNLKDKFTNFAKGQKPKKKYFKKAYKKFVKQSKSLGIKK